MRIWKQAISIVIILVAGVALSIRFIPQADAFAAKAGVPQNIVAAIAPSSAAPENTQAQGQGQAKTGDPGQGKGQGRQRGGNRATPLVVVSQVRTGVTNDSLTTIGTAQSIRSVSVTPSMSGRLAELNVRAGDKVKTGTVIARLEDTGEQIALDTARLGLSDAEEKLARLEKVTQTVSEQALEEARSKASAARLAVEQADLKLRQLQIVAPIDGTAGLVPVSVGDNVTNTTAIVSLDDRSEMLVEFRAPERFVTGLKLGMPVSLSEIGNGAAALSGTISALDNQLDTASRTIRVQAEVENRADTLRAGMALEVSVAFPGDSYASVDPLAVQWDSSGAFVYKVVDDKSVRTGVRLVDRRSDMVLVDGPLSEGDAVIVEGVQRTRNGGAVKVRGASEVKG